MVDNFESILFSTVGNSRYKDCKDIMTFLFGEPVIDEILTDDDLNVKKTVWHYVKGDTLKKLELEALPVENNTKNILDLKSYDL